MKFPISFYKLSVSNCFSILEVYVCNVLDCSDGLTFSVSRSPYQSQGENQFGL